MRWIKPLGNMLMPAVLFYAVYHAFGIIEAVTISLVCAFISIIYSKRKGNTIKNSQIAGWLGLVGSAAAVLFTGEEKLYYIPSIIENMFFLGIMTVLTVCHKSVLHFLAKDFEIESLNQISEESMFGVNIVWIVYFTLKIISKIIGILYLDFDKLYWLVFLLGDPVTVLVVIISVILIRRQYFKAGKDNR